MMYEKEKKVRPKDERNRVHQELIENFGGKSVPHRDKSKYRRKKKHKEDINEDYS